MAKQTGTSTNYRDLMNDLVTFATTEEAASATIQAAGTGYSASDVLTVVGGTFGTAATFTVATVGGSGEVLTITGPTAAGDYTATPSNPVTTTVAPAGGSGCTLNVTWQAKYGWVVKRHTQEALSATVGAGGTGYTVGDDLTISGGTKGTAAVFNVDTVSGGVVTAVSLVTAGDYTEQPTNPATTTGGTGSGCTLNVTYQDTTSVDLEMILEGNGSGSDTIYVGARTFQSGSAYNWELAGFTGYSSASTFSTQPGISPGRYDGVGNDRHGAYLPLNNSTLTYWFYVDSRRIIVEAKSGSSYPNAYLGWLDAPATSGEYAYPLAIIGCSSEHSKIFSDTDIGMSGMTDPIASYTYSTQGPGFVRDPGGVWRSVQNSYDSGSGRLVNDQVAVYPAGEIDATGLDAYRRPYLTNFGWGKVIPYTGDPGTATAAVEQTQDSPDYRTPLIPATVIGTPKGNNPETVFGELRGVFWISTKGETANIVAEDTVTEGATVYKVFQNCNRSDAWAHFAIKDE